MNGVTFQIHVPEPSRLALEKALRQTVAMKGADPIKTVNKAAGYVASFAAARGANAKIPVANPARIEALMRTVIASSSRRFANRVSISKKTGRVRKTRRLVRVSKVASEWKGTLAAAIVARINYKGSTRGSKRYERTIRAALSANDKGKAATSGAFYRLVGRFVRMRAKSAGYLRSGLFPAMKKFKQAAAQQSDPTSKNFKVPPGDAMAATRTGARIKATMEDYARGVDIVAPNALRQAEQQVADLFTKWIREDVAKAARTAGFHHSTP